MSDHVIDDLTALVAGDLSRDETDAVVAHLRSCDECRRHLVTNVAAAAALRSALRTAPELFDLAPAAEPAEVAVPEPAPARRRSARVRRPWRVVAAVAVGVVVIGAAAYTGFELNGPSVTTAHAPLVSVSGNPQSGGQVVMKTRDATTNMLVTATGLPQPAPGTFYEVWLFDPATGKMLSVGLLGPGNSGSYKLPQSLLAQYQAVDISLQQNNGNPAHSTDSVLRAKYA